MRKGVNVKRRKNKKLLIIFNDWSYGFLIHTTSMMLDVWYVMPLGITPHT
jgi:hypothetical protein